MGQGFFGGGWQAVTEPGWSYYIGEGLRSGILQAGYDRKTGETETWAALAAPFVGDGARTLVADIQRKRLAGSPDAPIPDPTLWYGHAIGSLTRAAVSEGIVHIAKKNDLSPQTTGLLTNLATGAMGGFIQAGFRQDGVSLGESVRQGIARGQYPAYRDFMTFGSPEQRFRGINHSLESSLYASRVLDFAQDSWLRKMRRPDGGIETKVGFYYGDVQRSRMTNIFVSQAASNIAIPVRQAFTDQFAIEGKYAEIFEKFIKDPRIPQATKDKFISVAAVHRKQYEALGGEAWERESTFSYKRGLKDISETSFGDFLSSLETDLGRLPAGIEEVTLGKNGKEVVFVPTDSLRTSRKYILRRWRECPVFLDGKKMFVDKDDIFTQVTLANGREAFFLPDKLRTSPSWRWNGFIEGETPEGKRVFINWSDISQPLRAVMTHGPKVERTEEAPDFSAFPTIPDKPVRERVPSYEKYLDSDKIYGDVTESIYYQEAVKDKLLKEGWLFRLDSAPQSP